jgi:hypothetical protein
MPADVSTVTQLIPKERESRDLGRWDDIIAGAPSNVPRRNFASSQNAQADLPEPVNGKGATRD